MLLGLTVFAAVTFLSEVYVNIKSIKTLPDSIAFNKGAYYLLGAGITVGIFCYILMLDFWLKKKTSRKMVKVMLRAAIAGIIVSVILPQVVYLGCDRYLRELGYGVCEEASHRWLHSVTLVYTKSSGVCQAVTPTPIQ